MACASLRPADEFMALKILQYGGHTTGRRSSESAQRLHLPKPFVISCGHLIISTRMRITDCRVQRARNEDIKILTPTDKHQQNALECLLCILSTIFPPTCFGH